ncbi:hypothetical protein [Nocardioides aestuarii]|uniref:Uncharacterized protein n=1 Tax=Nocardioides aestuarii TaxID=252231 RepID=A0ABW4TLY8_9ACTN
MTALAVLAPTLAGGAATAAADTTPPVLDLPERGAFVRLTTISATTFDAEANWPLSSSLQMRAQWSATDASGICGYSYREVLDDQTRPWTAWSSTKSVTRTVSDYDDQEGGGSDKFWGYDVRARDCAGNIATDFVRLAPVVYQQDGLAYRYEPLVVSKTGSWAITNCACWSAGTALRTSSSGARINFSMPADLAGSAYPVALVMERAPDRGQARVLVDGVRVATVDTRASSKVHRSIVWTGTLQGAHTLSVVNVGTSGRPRIDVDAVVSGAYSGSA